MSEDLIRKMLKSKPA